MHYTSGVVLIESKERNEFYYCLFSLILADRQGRDGTDLNGNAHMLFSTLKDIIQAQSKTSS